MNYFKLQEFNCKCGCNPSKIIMNPFLLNSLNSIRIKWNKPLIVSSGLRCAKHNKSIGGATHSAHLTGEAADLLDTDGSFYLFCADPELLRQLNLYLEEGTQGWVHLQSRKTNSRIFQK